MSRWLDGRFGADLAWLDARSDAGQNRRMLRRSGVLFLFVFCVCASVGGASAGTFTRTITFRWPAQANQSAVYTYTFTSPHVRSITFRAYGSTISAGLAGDQLVACFHRGPASLNWAWSQGGNGPVTLKVRAITGACDPGPSVAGTIGSVKLTIVTNSGTPGQIKAAQPAGGGGSVPSSSKKQPSSGGFSTPSGNIFCNYQTAVALNGGPSPFLYCAINSGIKPPAPRKGPTCTRALWPAIAPTGPASWQGSTCPGQDETQGPVAQLARQVLRYGQRWSWQGMQCTSTFSGLTCRNRSRHGFFMSSSRTNLF